MALIIAGERSGVGKTTITLALLSFLAQKGYKVQSFKVGPDYIDPMFHSTITRRYCRNLDPILTSETYVKSCFSQHTQEVEYALIEGVMGLFDGLRIENSSDFASTAHIARLLNLSVILVIDCSRLSGSVAAIAQGYRYFDPRINLAGVILNRVGSDRHLNLLKDALEPLNLPILGILHRQDNITIPDRHLGLIPTDELQSIQTLFAQLCQLAANAFDWEHLFPLLKVPLLKVPLFPLLGGVGVGGDLGGSLLKGDLGGAKVKIAIARDRAFNFYYADNFDILEQLGAELVFWSPLENESLPDDIQGLYFGGGFPEIFAQQLSENKQILQAVKNAIQAGMPTYAECGGLMYLCEDLVDFEQKNWSMVGILPTKAIMGDRLTLGYRQATSLENSPLCQIGQTIRGHEFHRSQLTNLPLQPLFELRNYHPDNPPSLEGWHFHQLHASYLHLHFGGCPSVAAKFLRSCLAFSR